MVPGRTDIQLHRCAIVPSTDVMARCQFYPEGRGCLKVSNRTRFQRKCRVRGAQILHPHPDQSSRGQDPAPVAAPLVAIETAGCGE